MFPYAYSWIDKNTLEFEVDGKNSKYLIQFDVDKKEVKNGSWEFEFEFPGKFAELIIEKGSICVNGISLTAFKVGKKKFRVAIIPYTFDHTNMQSLQKNDIVNLEFDVVGKYILRSIKVGKK